MQQCFEQHFNTLQEANEGFYLCLSKAYEKTSQRRPEQDKIALLSWLLQSYSSQGLLRVLLAIVELSNGLLSNGVLSHLLDVPSLEGNKTLDFTFGIEKMKVPGMYSEEKLVFMSDSVVFFRSYLQYLAPSQVVKKRRDVLIGGRSLVSDQRLYCRLSSEQVVETFLDYYTCHGEKTMFRQGDTTLLEAMMQRELKQRIRDRSLYRTNQSSWRFIVPITTILEELYKYIPNRVISCKMKDKLYYKITFQSMSKLSRLQCLLKLNSESFFARITAAVNKKYFMNLSCVAEMFSLIAFLGDLELLQKIERIFMTASSPISTDFRRVCYLKQDFFSFEDKHLATGMMFTDVPLLVALLNVDDKEVVIAKYISSQIEWNALNMKFFLRIAAKFQSYEKKRIAHLSCFQEHLKQSEAHVYWEAMRSK